jgi:lysozyme family protein
MSYFDDVFKMTMEFEGGYVDDPDDPGGETYKGIARKRHPSWYGWGEIDVVKASIEGYEPKALNRLLQENPIVQEAVKQFYRLRFWDEVMGDHISDFFLAREIFDTAVNMGPYNAIMFLQQALNILNRNQRLYNDILEDGKIGAITLSSVEALLRHDNIEDLIFWMNIFQGARYAFLMRKNPKLEKYARGWAKRVYIDKSFDMPSCNPF